MKVITSPEYLYHLKTVYDRITILFRRALTRQAPNILSLLSAIAP